MKLGILDKHKAINLYESNICIVKSFYYIINPMYSKYLLDLNETLYEAFKYEGIFFGIDPNYWFIPICREEIKVKGFINYNEFLKGKAIEYINSIHIVNDFYFVGYVIKVPKEEADKFKESITEISDKNFEILKVSLKNLNTKSYKSEEGLIEGHLFFNMRKFIVNLIERVKKDT